MRADTGLRQEIAAERQVLQRGYMERPNPRLLLRRHTQLIDRTAKAVWKRSGVPHGAALVATGGYGRSELFPSSDIDLLVLLAREPGEDERGALERLIGTLWDVGLEIGHSVRTVQGCVDAAASDITVRTTLLEARFLAGSRSLYRDMAAALARSAEPAAFLKAKQMGIPFGVYAHSFDKLEPFTELFTRTVPTPA